MSLRLRLLERRLPAAARRHMLRRLVRATASAFSVPPPALPDPCDDGFVEAFARFTRAEAERVGDASPEAAMVRARLYDGARAIGRSIRRWAGVRTPGDAVRALRLVYGAIGIDLQANLEAGTVTVPRCAFSRVYTPEVCHFVSALDAGLFHGVSGAWRVTFTDRLTSGAAACRGHLAEVPRP